MDRNNLFADPGSTMLTSLSARRAWIEMRVKFGLSLLTYVALRKESVDRNVGLSALAPKENTSRSPQGERG